jgi:hypothetical protein
MGFLRKLLGREPVWAEQWEVFPGEFGGQPAMFNVDLGAVDVAPVGRLPVRLDVEFSYPHDGVTGMPGDAQLASIHELDDAVRRAVAPLGGAYVGRVLSGGNGQIACYLPPDVTVVPAVPAVGGLAPRAALVPDPAWSRVREELTPDAWQRHVIEDSHLVQALEEHGDRLAAPREVEHIAYFADLDRAGDAANVLREAGFAVTVERDDEGEYELEAVRRDPVEPPAVHEVTWLVRETVERHDGLYDGWGCTPQS